MAMRGLVILCTICGACLALLLRTPVPDGLTEPWKYRALVASTKVQALLAKTNAYFNADNQYAYIQGLRAARDFTNRPSSSEVQGSNIRSKVVTFDGVRVRLYQPIKKKKSLQPAVIYIHGGGYALGSADGYDRRTRDLAERINMVVASIDYRLTPENPFPAGHEDCVRATTWFLRHARKDFGVDPTRVAISGDSAGGMLSASVSQMINDDASLPNLKLQILIYPATQTLDLLTPSFRQYEDEFGDEGILPRKRVAAFTSMLLYGKVDTLYMKQILANEHITDKFRTRSRYMEYVNHDVIAKGLQREIHHGEAKGTAASKSSGNETLWKSLKDTYLDARWAPLMRKDMTGLPQAFVATCEFDSIRDDGIFYAHRLEAAGVTTNWRHYQTGFHGIFFINNLFWFDVGEEMTSDITEFIRTNI